MSLLFMMTGQRLHEHGECLERRQTATVAPFIDVYVPKHVSVRAPTSYSYSLQLNEYARPPHMLRCKLW